MGLKTVAFELFACMVFSADAVGCLTHQEFCNVNGWIISRRSNFFYWPDVLLIAGKYQLHHKMTFTILRLLLHKIIISSELTVHLAVPWLRQLVAGLLLRRPGSSSG
jgi:hypothetical protein